MDPPFRVISSEEAAREAAGSLGGHVVPKALIPAGGRGKARAIERTPSPDEAFDQAWGHSLYLSAERELPHTL